MRIWVAIAVTALLAVPAASTANKPAPNVRGALTRGPVLPVCIEGRACDAPAPNVVLVFSAAGHEVKRVTTGVAGRFALRLRPGTYFVTTARKALLGSVLTPARFRVPANGAVILRLHLDSGIR